MTVPIIVNTEPLVADERLTLKWDTIKTKKEKRKTKETIKETWLDAYIPKKANRKKHRTAEWAGD